MKLLLRAHMRYLWQDRWQTLLAVFGVSVGVAVVLAVDLANAASREAMQVAQRQLDGVATHAIVGAGERIDELAYPRLRLRWRQGAPVFADVRAMAPVVTAETRIGLTPDSMTRPVQLLGIDPTADAGMRASVPGPGGGGGRLMSEPGTALLDAATARRLGVDLDADGDVQLWIQAAGRARPLRLVGTFSLGDAALGQGLLVTDIATAQEWLERVGWLSRIDLIRGDPVSQHAFGRMLERVFPGLVLRSPRRETEELEDGLRIQSLAERAADTRALAASFQLNLAALGLLALVVGLFLVHGTLGHAVLRRQRAFARLRAIGVRAGELRRMVLAEAAVIGVAGVLLGLLFGRWLASGLLALTAGTLENLYGQVTVAAFAPDPVPVIKAAGVGLFATVLAALPASARAAAVTPGLFATAGAPSASHRLRPLLLTGLLLLAGVALLPAAGYLGGLVAIAALLMATALLTPVWITAVLSGMTRLLGAAPLRFRLLLREAVRGLTRSGVAGAALVVAMATALGMGLMVDSFRSSVDRWLEARLAAPLHVQLSGEWTQLPGDLEAALTDTAAGHVVRVSWSDRIAGEPVRVSHIRRQGNVPADLGLALLAGRFADDGLAVSEPLARRLGLMPGSMLRLPVADGVRELTVTGVFREYGAGPGLILVPEATGVPVLSGQLAVEVHGLRADADADQIAAELVLAAPDGTRVRRNDELLAIARGVFERTFEVTGVLKSIAGAVAAFGLFAALTALGLERRAQYGILRTLGVDRALPAWLNLGEASLLAISAVLLALPLGVLVAIILIEVVNVRAFGWSLDWSFPPWLFLQALGIGLLAGWAAALAPALAVWRADPAVLLAEARVHA
ncbi:MAG: FtsX-like permease family protein [Gammaproteobacteria bacterium]|nr:MAG: FtsX-like permease family protein [Gammaproteobacteria bacterium]